MQNNTTATRKQLFPYAKQINLIITSSLEIYENVYRYHNTFEIAETELMI